MADTSAPERRPYTGSCHCGSVQFVVYLTLPFQPPPCPPRRGVQTFYRCNCTICHKTGIFHVRLNSSPDDFLLLSPLDPLQEMGDYQTGRKDLHSLFCKGCGVRCFVFMGESEFVTVDLAELGVTGAKTGSVKAWKPKAEGWQEGRQRGCYLSVNATAIDQRQGGVDLRDWTDNKWVMYYDCLRDDHEGRLEVRLERPHDYGCY